MASEYFTASEDEILISFVSQRPQLYDHNAPDYRNSYKRDRSWELLAKQLQKTRKACKSRWRNIKDTYFRQKKKSLQSTSWADHPRSKYYKYCDKLGFLDAVSRDRSNNTAEEEYPQYLTVHSPDLTDGNDGMSDSENSVSNQTQTIAEETSIEAIAPSLIQSDYVPKKSRKRLHEEDFLNYLQKRDEIRQSMIQNLLSKNTKESDDEVDLFTRQANTVLRKLPAQIQIRAMQELFETLTKYKMIAAGGPGVQGTNPSSSHKQIGAT